MKSLWFAILASVILVFSSGCRTEVEVDLFASDLFDSAENFDASAELFFEIPGKDWLADPENRRKLEKLVVPYFGEPGELSTTEVEVRSFCVVPIKVPVFTEPGKVKVFGLSYDPTDDGGVEVACWMSPDWFESFQKAVRTELMTSIDLEDVEFRLILNNDTGGPVRVIGSSVYLGKVPAAFTAEISLEHREDVVIRISEIHLAAIHSAGVAAEAVGNSRLIAIYKSDSAEE